MEDPVPAVRAKPFLGGYRNRINDIEYHHAVAQTLPRFRFPKVYLMCRDTQTLQQKNVRAQAAHDATTQMTKIGVYVSAEDDKLLTPRDVPTVDQWLEERLRKIVLIQSYWRRWLAHRRVARLKNEKAERERVEQEVQNAIVSEKETVLWHEYARRTHPRTKSDFDLVYKTIENWRKQEVSKINEGFDGPERKAMLCKVHKEESALLLAVEGHKARARKENEKSGKERLLDKVAKPLEFISSRHRLMQMETPWVTRAKELVALYRALTDKSFNKSERLDLLLSVTITVSEFMCDLTSEMSNLIDREVTMLTRGVKTTDHVLDGMRTRLSNLFLEFLKNPLFNPQVARYLPAPPAANGQARLATTVQHCSGCGVHRAASDFHLSVNPRIHTLTCQECERTKNIATRRADLGYFRLILKDLRANEAIQTEIPHPILAVLTEHEIKYLMENIWRLASPVSGRRDLYDLKLVRWNTRELWSPWNCILLTREEAVLHLKMINRQVYSEALTKRIAYNHRIARIRFEPLLTAAKHRIHPTKRSASVSDKKKVPLSDLLAACANSSA